MMTRGISKSVRALTVGATSAVLLAGSAWGAAQALHATQDPQQISTFTLDFGDFGATNSNITVTQFSLAVDSVQNAGRFANYYQHVDSLTLPGGFATGPITVSVVPGTSHGTYDPATGEVRTTEFYEVAFAGDLSPFGLTSPVYLPGTSVGTVAFDAPGAGHIDLVWDGVGQLSNPDPNGEPIVFSYQCRTRTTFDPPHVADMNCDGDVDFFDIDPFVEALSNPLAFVAGSPTCQINNADVNADGTMNPFDIQALVDLIGG